MRKQRTHFQDYKDALKPPKVGQIIKGKVIGKENQRVFLDLENYKTGFITKQDIVGGGKSLSKIKKDDEISAKIVDIENAEGYVALSLREADRDLAWNKFRDLQAKGEEISLKVAGANRGGLMFNLSGVQGFLPVSQLSRENYPRIENPTPEKIFEELKKFVGQEMKVKVIKVEPRDKGLILRES